MKFLLENLLNDKLSNPTFFRLVKMCAKNQHVLTNFDLSHIHCSHMDVYISQKPRLYIVNLEGQFEISLEAKLFGMKFQIHYSHFYSIFSSNCQIQCFLDTVNAISKGLKCLSHIFASNCNLSTSTLWNSSNSVQKELDLTTSAKK